MKLAIVWDAQFWHEFIKEEFRKDFQESQTLVFHFRFQIAPEMLRFLVPVLLSAAAYIYLPKYIRTLKYQNLVSTIFVENNLFIMLLMSFRS